MYSMNVKKLPNYKKELPYSIRGVVEAHDVHKSGWWIFKKKNPVIYVRANEDQLASFNKILRSLVIAPFGTHLNNLPPVFKVGLTYDENPSEFPIGAEIGITIGYMPLEEQAFNGDQPIRVVKLQIAHPGVKLDNELLTAA